MRHGQGWASRQMYIVVLPLLLLLATTAATAGEAGRPNGFSDALFNVFLEGKPTSEYVVLTVRVDSSMNGLCEVDAQAAFLKEDPHNVGYGITLRSFSTQDTTVTRATLTGDTLAFDLHLDGRDADKKIRMRAIWDQDAKTFRLKASGLWSDQTHTTFVRAQWRQIEQIDLKYPRLVPSRTF